MKETFHKRVKTRVLRLSHRLTQSIQENSVAAKEMCRDCFTAYPSSHCNNITPKSVSFRTKTAFVVSQCVYAISWKLACTGAKWTVALKRKILNSPSAWIHEFHGLFHCWKHQSHSVLGTS
jgi:hypothetical protein